MRAVVLPSNGLTELAGLAVSPDGNRVLATDLIMTGVRIFDAASLRLIQTISWTTGVQMVNGVAISHNAGQIFTANVKTGNLGIISQVQGSGSELPVPPRSPPSARLAMTATRGCS